jgi:hypothetical protein
MANEGLTLVRDRWYTALTADVTSAATTLPVVTNTVGGNALPTPCIIMCGFEQMYATASTATTITVTRGFNSTAAAHAKGSTVGIARVAAHHNDMVAALAALGAGSQPFVSLSDANNQSIANTTSVDVTWATETEDTFAMHTGSSASVTIPTSYSGIYIAIAQVVWATGGTGARQLQIHNTGVAIVGTASSPPLTTAGYVQCVAIFRAAAGTAVRVVAYQDSGGAINISGASFASNFRLGRVAV